MKTMLLMLIGLYVLRPSPGQWMRVRSEFVKSLAPRVDVLY
jgi:hypothetical protein